MASRARPVVKHLTKGAFKGDGLRGFFEYRDLGINGATKGGFGAHVIRAAKGQPKKERLKGSDGHTHALDFQMVYVLKGWVDFQYEGRPGVTRLEAGSCVFQPPSIRHREVGHSEDIEMLEIVMPANFATEEVPTVEG